MEKIYEKKNLGIPVIILNILAYLIGYSFTRSLSGTLLIAILYAGVVFTLQFDDRVKNAIKHSYIFATFFILIGFVFDIFELLISIFSSGRFSDLSAFQDVTYSFGIIPRALPFINTYAVIIIDVAAVVLFGLFILMTLLKKDMNLVCVRRILEEVPTQKKNQPPKPQTPANKQPSEPPVAPKAPESPHGQQPVEQQPPAPPVAPKAPEPPHGQQPVEQQPPAPPVAPKAPEPPHRQQPMAQQPPVPPVAPEPVRQVPGACSHCGHINVAGAKFCASCGSKLK